MDELLSIEQNFPTYDNLRFFKSAADLLRKNKFLKLADTKLHLIIGVCQPELIKYERLRKPANPVKLFADLRKVGWTV